MIGSGDPADSVGGITAAGLMAGVIFGAVGLGAFIYGKKTGRWRHMLIGVALMAFPYFVPSTLWQYVIGAVLTVGLFFPPGD